ncbi:extracellular solute-binding protein [Paenibacillus oryzisoli]|uniref:ABC transporter substrate-binding protein n=1 Tax=Paenibacillus oryzisoli TaxID=1850517 RepID=UPI003D2A5E9E
MKMMSGKMLGMACLVALSATLAGCGDSGTTSPATTAPAAAENQTAKPADSGKPVTLRFSWWGSDVRHKATLAAIDAYTKLNPNVKIEGEYQGYDGYQQKIMTQIAGGSAPDIMQLDYPWLSDLAAQGDIFMDLSKESAIDLTQFPKKILDEYDSVNGKLVSLPMGTNGFGTMINKAFFDKNGLDTKTQWTWEKLIEEGEKLNQKSKNQFLFAIEPGTTTGGLGEFVLNEYLYSKNGTYWVSNDPAIKASKEDIAQGLTVMKKLFDSGAAQPLGDAALFSGKMEQNPKWVNAEMGMTLDWSSTVGKYKAAAGDGKFAVGMPIFAKDGKAQAVKTKPSMIVSVNKKSANAQEAVKFVNWLLNSKDASLILLDTRSVPTSESAKQALVEANKIDPDIAKMVDSALKNPASSPPTVQNNPEVADIIRDVCEKVVYGNLTPDKGAEQLMQRVQEKFKDIK